jgi:uncharacterized protein YbjT (DUF2867 family)
MTILVTGGTGTVGGAVVKALVQAGEQPRVLLRNPERAGSLPGGALSVIGDLQNPASLSAAFDGAERVFLLNALAQDETAQGLAAVEAAKKAGVKRIVYMTVHRLDEGLHIPHFATKKPVEDAVMASGVEWTILQPNNFFQNDYWFKDAMLQYGVYPQPIGSIGCNRVDAGDIAAAAAAALTQDGYTGTKYPLVGPEVLNGPATAELWSRHLGRTVQYGGDDLEAWGAQAEQMLPAWLVHDLKIMYAHFQQNGLTATAEELAFQEKVLGRPPRRFDDFAAETAAAWR